MTRIVPPLMFGVVRRWRVASACVLALAAGHAASAQTAPAPATPPATPAPAAPASSEPASFAVSSLQLEYLKSGVEGAPSIDDLRNVRVTFGVRDGVLTFNSAGLDTRTLAIGDVGQPGQDKIDGRGLEAASLAIVEFLSKRGLLAVGPFVDPDDIIREREGGVARYRDVRKDGKTSIRIFILTATVQEVRSIDARADDPDKPGEMRVNPDSKVHRRIRDRSPLQKGALLQSAPLDNYVARLNRHPGRHVDAALGSAAKPGEEAVPGDVTIDFMVNQAKPWTVYAQISNTGTKSTNEWRERFGFISNQLTGNDDILQLDYSTAGFDSSHAVIGSYDFRIVERLRGKVYGSWNTYTASDLGVNGRDFDGDGWSAGGELAFNAYQRGPFFLDLVAGMRYESNSIQEVAQSGGQATPEGSSKFLIPYGGVRMERTTEANSLFASLMFEGPVHDDVENFQTIGRLNADTEWFVMKYELSGSTYLEPLISPSTWAGQSDKGPKTLAHEVVGSLRGQWAIDGRLVPTAEQPIGGMLSVRGYPESYTAGDSTIVASAEYRFHLPRALGMESEESRKNTLMGGPFRARPWEPYGRTDWDLIFRGFIDAGKVFNTRRETYEKDRTLVGAGVGVEFQFKNYVSIRVDWAFPLQDQEVTGNSRVQVGDSRFHILATFAY